MHVIYWTAKLRQEHEAAEREKELSAKVEQLVVKNKQLTETVRVHAQSLRRKESSLF